MEFSRQEYWSGLSFTSTGSSWHRNQTLVSCIAGRLPIVCATREATNGHEFEPTPRDSGSLVCCNPWGREESDITKWPNSKSLLQHHSSKASILWCSAFFTGQLSHPYMITGKTIALTRRTFVAKVMSLLLNMLSRLVITFFPRSKCLNFMAAVTICSDFGAPQIKSVTISTVSPSICHEVADRDTYQIPWRDQMPWS